MKAFVTTALAALTLGVPVAAADPDGYQPQLKSVDQSDVIARYLEREGRLAPTDVVDRAVANRNRVVPQDAFDRAPIADRPASTTPFTPSAADTDGGLHGVELAGALALALAVGAAAAALVPLGRRTPAHR
jgi:hypothetical protein